MSLTVAAVERLKSGNSRREIPDDRPKGLYLVIQSSGKKSWALRTRIHGNPVKLTIGTYPAWGLTDAREDAGNMLQAIERGKDPRIEKAGRKEEERQQAADTVKKVVADWLERDQSKNRSHDDVERAMNMDVIPAWGRRPIGTITKRDAVELIDKITDRGAETMARRMYAYLHRMFRWSVTREIIQTNPMAGMEKPGSETRRERVLTDDEMVRLWRASEKLGLPFGEAVRLLMLTGARRSEITGLRLSEVSDDKIQLPGARTKSKKEHTIPLALEASTIIKGLPRISNPDTKRAELYFTTTGKTPVSGWSKAKIRLDEEAAKIAPDGGKLDKPKPLPHWRIHDIRRTVATGLQELGFRLEVIEAVLGHVSGSRAGIVGVYQRHSFDKEKRMALEAWARHLSGLSAAQPANVVNMRGADSA